MMEPVFVEREKIVLAGFSFFGDPFQASGGWTEENEIGRIWQRFMTYLEKHSARLPQMVNPQQAFEVHIEHPETAVKGHVEVFVGVEIASAKGVPVEVVVKELPATTYAVFALRGSEITGDWPRRIYVEWLPNSEYEESHRYLIQLYDERFKGLEAEQLAASELDIYVPVQRRR